MTVFETEKISRRRAAVAAAIATLVMAGARKEVVGRFPAVAVEGVLPHASL